MEYSRYEEPNWRLPTPARAKSTRSGDPGREDISESGTASAVTWLLVGIGIGAGVALLFAPSSGRELRSAIGRGCRRTVDGISRGTQELRQRGSNLLNFTRWRSGEKLREG